MTNYQLIQTAEDSAKTNAYSIYRLFIDSDFISKEAVRKALFRAHRIVASLQILMEDEKL